MQWPGLKAVDVDPKRSFVFRTAAGVELVKLLEYEHIAARDPRLSLTLPATSIYYVVMGSWEGEGEGADAMDTVDKQTEAIASPAHTAPDNDEELEADLLRTQLLAMHMKPHADLRDTGTEVRPPSRQTSLPMARQEVEGGYAQYSGEEEQAYKPMFHPLSYATKHCLKVAMTKDGFKYGSTRCVDELVQLMSSRFDSEVDSICRGEVQPSAFSKKLHHLRALPYSLKARCLQVDAPLVDQLHRDVIRSWERSMPLDMMLSGRYKAPVIKMSDELPTSSLTDTTSEHMIAALRKRLDEIARPATHTYSSDNVFPQPASLTEQTVADMHDLLSASLEDVCETRKRSGDTDMEPLQISVKRPRTVSAGETPTPAVNLAEAKYEKLTRVIVNEGAAKPADSVKATPAPSVKPVATTSEKKVTGGKKVTSEKKVTGDKQSSGRGALSDGELEEDSENVSPSRGRSASKKKVKVDKDDKAKRSSSSKKESSSKRDKSNDKRSSSSQKKTSSSSSKVKDKKASKDVKKSSSKGDKKHSKDSGKSERSKPTDSKTDKPIVAPAVPVDKPAVTSAFSSFVESTPAGSASVSVVNEAACSKLSTALHDFISKNLDVVRSGKQSGYKPVANVELWSLVECVVELSEGGGEGADIGMSVTDVHDSLDEELALLSVAMEDTVGEENTADLLPAFAAQAQLMVAGAQASDRQSCLAVCQAISDDVVKTKRGSAVSLKFTPTGKADDAKGAKDTDTGKAADAGEKKRLVDVFFNSDDEDGSKKKKLTSISKSTMNRGDKIEDEPSLTVPSNKLPSKLAAQSSFIKKLAEDTATSDTTASTVASKPPDKKDKAKVSDKVKDKKSADCEKKVGEEKKKKTEIVRVVATKPKQAEKAGDTGDQKQVTSDTPASERKVTMEPVKPGQVNLTVSVITPVTSVTSPALPVTSPAVSSTAQKKNKFTMDITGEKTVVTAVHVPVPSSVIIAKNPSYDAKTAAKTAAAAAASAGSSAMSNSMSATISLLAAQSTAVTRTPPPPPPLPASKIATASSTEVSKVTASISAPPVKSADAAAPPPPPSAFSEAPPLPTAEDGDTDPETQQRLYAAYSSGDWQTYCSILSSLAQTPEQHQQVAAYYQYVTDVHRQYQAQYQSWLEQTQRAQAAALAAGGQQMDVATLAQHYQQMGYPADVATHWANAQRNLAAASGTSADSSSDTAAQQAAQQQQMWLQWQQHQQAMAMSAYPRPPFGARWPMPPPGTRPPYRPPYMAVRGPVPPGARLPFYGYPGMMAPPPPADLAEGMRVYVFNEHKDHCKAAQELLLSMAALKFDPHQVDIAKYIADSELFIFIHEEDVAGLHLVPNLLALKQVAELKFLSFTDTTDVRECVVNNVQRLLLPKGGVLIADDTVLLDADPDELQSLCEFLEEQSKADTPWLLRVHDRTLKELDRRRMFNPTDSHRLTEVLETLTHFRDNAKVVEFMAQHQCDTHAKPAHEYEACCCRQQVELARKHRHFFLLTDLPTSAREAQPLLDKGIGLLTIADFFYFFAGSDAQQTTAYKPRNYGPRSNPVYVDVGLSTAVKSVPVQQLEHYISLMRAEDEAAAAAKAEDKTPAQFAQQPPAMATGPPPALSGPPPAMSGPPPVISGPPPAISGPPPVISGPPPAMSGPPSVISGLPPAMSGPPSTMSASPQILSAPPPTLIGQPPRVGDPRQTGPRPSPLFPPNQRHQGQGHREAGVPQGVPPPEPFRSLAPRPLNESIRLRPTRLEGPSMRPMAAPVRPPLVTSDTMTAPVKPSLSAGDTRSMAAPVRPPLSAGDTRPAPVRPLMDNPIRRPLRPPLAAPMEGMARRPPPLHDRPMRPGGPRFLPPMAEPVRPPALSRLPQRPPGPLPRHRPPGPRGPPPDHSDMMDVPWDMF